MRYGLRTTSIALGIAAAVMSSSAFAASDNPPPSMGSIQKMVYSGKYRDAISELGAYLQEKPGSADAHNLMGYSYRQLGDLDRARRSYSRALAIDANHKGANEYLGELYLKENNVAAAEEQLAKLETICGTACDEYEMLRASIQKHKGS